MINGLNIVFLNSEDDYIDRFCKEYKDSIETPDGFIIKCIYPRRTAIHFFCGGGRGSNFQKARAQKLLWAKYILLNQEERRILKDEKTNNIIFFFERKKNCYVVVCRPIDIDRKVLSLISGFIVGGKRVVDYREANPPYSCYE